MVSNIKVSGYEHRLSLSLSCLALRIIDTKRKRMLVANLTNGLRYKEVVLKVVGQ